MRLAVGLNLLLLAGAAQTKKPAVHHCQQADGTVVIQDRRCIATHLPEAKPISRPDSRPEQATKPTNNNAQSRTAPPANAQAPKRRWSASAKPSNQRQTRSPYFAADWARFFPDHWQKLRIQTQQHEQWLVSQQAFQGLGDFRQGVRLAVYANTLNKQQQGAFALALQLYEGIRDNPQITLLDSQYKSHPHFKVFNVKYLKHNRDLAVTEYYIDDHHNDLFVLTVQAPEVNWSAQWQLAEQIINRL